MTSNLAFRPDDEDVAGATTVGHLRGAENHVPDRAWLERGKEDAVNIKLTPADVAEEGRITAKMWNSHPGYRMTLPSVQAAFDTDGDGIEKHEFAAMLKAAGSNANAEALWARMDDGDGVLTSAEIKSLVQGGRKRPGRR